MNRKLMLVMGVLGMSACGSHYTSEGEAHYLQARNGQGLIVPASLHGENISHHYDLPAQTQDPVVSIAPPA